MNVAASVRASKERTPEHYCSAPRCLWRVYDARTDTYSACGNHPTLPVGVRFRRPCDCPLTCTQNSTALRARGTATFAQGFL